MTPHEDNPERQLTAEWRVLVMERLNGLDKDLRYVRDNMGTSATIKDLESRVRDLENDRNRAQGGYKMILVIAGILGAAISWLVTFLFKKP